MRLLLIEDDAALAAPLKEALASAGYAVDIAANGIDGEHLGFEIDYDVVVLDLGLPGKPGLEVLRSWRAKNRQLPVLVLTARDAWHERVDGLKAGADDYLGKPFHSEELLARIEALIRRQHGGGGAALRVAGITLDEARQVAIGADGIEQTLTATEFRLLRYLMRNPNRLLSKSQILEHIYDDEADPDSNVVEVYVNRLRQKFGKARIATRRGQGYIFTGEGH